MFPSKEYVPWGSRRWYEYLHTKESQQCFSFRAYIRRSTEGPLIGHQVLPDHYKLLFLIVITALFPLLLSVREQNHLIS